METGEEDAEALQVVTSKEIHKEEVGACIHYYRILCSVCHRLQHCASQQWEL